MNKYPLPSFHNYCTPATASTNHSKGCKWAAIVKTIPRKPSLTEVDTFLVLYQPCKDVRLLCQCFYK